MLICRVFSLKKYFCSFIFFSYIRTQRRFVWRIYFLRSPFHRTRITFSIWAVFLRWHFPGSLGSRRKIIVIHALCLYLFGVEASSPPHNRSRLYSTYFSVRQKDVCTQNVGERQREKWKQFHVHLTRRLIYALYDLRRMETEERFYFEHFGYFLSLSLWLSQEKRSFPSLAKHASYNFFFRGSCWWDEERRWSWW